MPRVKGGTHANKRRRNILSRTKGYKYGRSTKERQAREAWFHAGNNAFAHRRKKKNDFRRLWQTKISAAVTPYGFSYSTFMDALKKKSIDLNRKVLAEMAEENPEAFEQVVAHVKK